MENINKRAMFEELLLRAFNQKQISKEDAKTIALKDAGLTQADIRDFEIELDMEAGVLTYEISFKNKNIEYDYDIKASDGTIINSHKESDD